MPDAPERRRFGLNVEPHEADLVDATYQFLPEAYAEDMLGAWEAVTPPSKEEITAAAEAAGVTEDRIRVEGGTARLREFLGKLMLPASRAEFDRMEPVLDGEGAPVLGDDGEPKMQLAHRYPDRVLVEMQRWLLEVYGLRPTSRSPGSLEPSVAEGGEPSTASTSDEG